MVVFHHGLILHLDSALERLVATLGYHWFALTHSCPLCGPYLLSHSILVEVDHRSMLSLSKFDPCKRPRRGSSTAIRARPIETKGNDTPPNIDHTTTKRSPEHHRSVVAVNSKRLPEENSPRLSASTAEYAVTDTRLRRQLFVNMLVPIRGNHP